MALPSSQCPWTHWTEQRILLQQRYYLTLLFYIYESKRARNIILFCKKKMNIQGNIQQCPWRCCSSGHIIYKAGNGTEHHIEPSAYFLMAHLVLPLPPVLQIQGSALSSGSSGMASHWATSNASPAQIIPDASANIFVCCRCSLTTMLLSSLTFSCWVACEPIQTHTQHL